MEICRLKLTRRLLISNQIVRPTLESLSAIEEMDEVY